MIPQRATRRHSATVLASAMALVATPLCAQHTPDEQRNTTSIVRLTPPLDTLFTLEIQSQQRTRSGKFITFISRYNVQFITIDTHLGIEAVLTHIDCDGPPTVAQAFQIALSGAKGQAMRAMIAPENGALVLIDVPKDTARLILAKLGAEELFSEMQPQNGPSETSKAMWIDDIAQLLRFANVDMDRMDIQNSGQLAAKLNILKQQPDGWFLQFENAGTAATLVSSEIEIARDSGIIRRSITDVRYRDTSDDSGLISRKTMLFSKSGIAIQPKP